MAKQTDLQPYCLWAHCLPLVILEGVKVGLYDKFSSHTKVGLQVLIEGTFTPLSKIIKMGDDMAFGSKTNAWKPDYLIIFLMFYATIIAVSFITADRNRNKSHNKDGDMKFGKIDDYNRDMAQPLGKEEVSETDNEILSKNVRYSLTGTPYTYSCSFITGPTGSSKTFRFAKPNILQMNCSFVITDPKCELLHDLGKCLSDNGYDVLLFNLKKGEQCFSCRYNPFAYIRSEQDVILAVDSFLDATTDTGATGGDPFFPIAEKNFYYALFYYVFTALPYEKRTLKAVYELYSEADEQEPSGNNKKRAEVLESNFDKAFMDIAEKDPYNPALPFYKTFKKGSPKTKQSILISVGIKMWFLSVPETANLLSVDDLLLYPIGERKTALFIAMPVDNDSFKCLSAMLFSQLFQELYYQGETLNQRTYLIRKGMYTAGRSSQFVEGAGEEDARNEMIERQRYFQNATVVYEKDLAEENADIKRYLSTPLNKELKIYPFPMYVVCDDPDPEKAHIYEKFRSKKAAEMYLDCGQTGEIVNLQKGLAVRTRFILDEFYAIGKINGFEGKIATFRSLKVSCDIICQNVQQLKEMYDDKEGKVTGNCDIKICLGVNDLEDAKMFSDMVGQTTVRSESTNIKNTGLVQGSDGGSLSDNAQMLIRPEWLLNQMKGDECLILTRTTLPIKDKKYNPKEQHPMWKYTYDEYNESSWENAYQFRRIYYIEQKPENRVKTNLVRQQKAIAENSDSETLSLTDGSAPLKLPASRVAKNVTAKERLEIMRERYKERLESAKEEQEYKRDENGNIPVATLTESEKARLKKGIIKGDIVQDKKDENKLVSRRFDTGDALSALTDML